ncbi:MAG: phage baseplate assembly protein V [Lachnospiraceae bacterium]|nr:phage baseplate assembly protein V [Lachnospiraceae bacterium]
MALYDEIESISQKNIVKTTTGDERIYGVAIGIVAEDYSDEMPGRICVIIPTRDSDANKLRWAKVTPPYGGNKWGEYFIPEKNDQVLLAFENGNIEKPFVIGAVHRDNDKYIKECTNKDNQIKKIKTRNGSNITFFDSVPDDNGEKDKISVTTANDSHTFILDNENKKMEMYDKEKNCHVEMLTEKGIMNIKAATKLVLKVGDDITITMDGEKGKITVKANDLSYNIGKNVNVSAGGNLKLEGQQIAENASSGMKLSAEMFTASASIVKLG